MYEKMTIARPYAQAVFEIASQEKSLLEWSAMLALIESIVIDDQMKQLIVNPRLDSMALADLILSLCDTQLSVTGSNFVKVLVTANRLDCIPEIKGLYEQFRAKAEGITKVNVLVAYELTAEQRSIIAASMAQHLGGIIEINSEVDSSLIGGIVIQAGDMVIDASVKGRLKAMNNMLVS